MTDLPQELHSALAEASSFADPDILRAMDEEFAELTQEIQRINSLPVGRVRETNIEALREHWRSRAKDRVNLPPWRRRLDEALEQAFERMLIESRDRVTNQPGGGPLSLQLDGDSMLRHGAPVMAALLEGLQVALNEKLSTLGGTLSLAASQFSKAATTPATVTATATAPASPQTQTQTQAPAATTPTTPAAATPAAATPQTPAAATPQTPAAAKPSIQVNVNLQGLLGSLLKQMQPAAPASSPPPKAPSPPPQTPPSKPKKK